MMTTIVYLVVILGIVIGSQIRGIDIFAIFAHICVIPTYVLLFAIATVAVES